jgi:hypothetical protein
MVEQVTALIDGNARRIKSGASGIPPSQPGIVDLIHVDQAD